MSERTHQCECPSESYGRQVWPVADRWNFDQLIDLPVRMVASEGDECETRRMSALVDALTLTGSSIIVIGSSGSGVQHADR
jgi:hypothetical protein